MARPAERNPDGVEGDWYVDTRCIDCGACRHVAPDLIVEVGELSVFSAQPEGPEQLHRAWLAAELCPTQSIGTESRLERPEGLYPHEIEPGVHLCGYNARSSFGAHSWLVTRDGGNLLVDSPRFTRRLREPVEEMGGISTILLTHRDDVADAQRWADHFGATVWIHEADRQAAPYATDLLEGDDPVGILPGVVAVPVPGHTRGSVVYLVDDALAFTGDSLCWNGDDLDAFEYACWYSWDVQRDSLARLAEHRFEQVFAGHGSWSPRHPAEEMRERLEALTRRM